MGLKKPSIIKGIAIPSDTEIVYQDTTTYTLDTVGNQIVGKTMNIKADGTIRLKVQYSGGYYGLNYQLNGIDSVMVSISNTTGTAVVDIAVKKNDFLKVIAIKSDAQSNAKILNISLCGIYKLDNNKNYLVGVS